MKTGLKIGARERLEISLVVKYANSKKVALSQTHNCFEDDRLTCRLGVYQTCYSIQERSDGLAKHIAVRDIGQGNIPQPNVVDEIMKEFGFALGVAESKSRLLGSTVDVTEKLYESEGVPL